MSIKISKQKLHITALIMTVIMIGYAVAYLYEGIITVPSEGDSMAYHIPIAELILRGKVFSPDFYLGYYPGNAEVILSVFIFLGIPLNTYNVIAWTLLFFALFYLGMSFSLKREFSLIYAGAVCLTHSNIRWLNSQIIDIWFVLFYSICLMLLQSFNRSRRHYFLLGIAVGLLIGTKYSGPLFAAVLFIIYLKKIAKRLTFIKVLLFSIPFTLLGLSWYIRNFLVVHNPVYPQPLFGMEGKPGWKIFAVRVWEATVLYPQQMVNAYFAEYMIWPFLLILVLAVIIIKVLKGRVGDTALKILLLTGISNLFIYFLLPTSGDYNIIVSSFRYSYPAFIPLMLAMFVYLQIIKKQLPLILAVFSNITMLPSLSYRPKLLVPIFLLTLTIIYWNKILHIIKYYKQ